jgi:hypothetical protein
MTTLIVATSDKGGTGRSVTSSNIIYRRALHGSDVCYLDFDFGSPTVGAIFGLDSIPRGTDQGGLHSYLQGRVAEPHRVDIWAETDRESLRSRPPGAGRLVLMPGDRGGGEFSITKDVVNRCVKLFLRLQEEFELCLVDISAGRSYAADMMLAATAHPDMRSIGARWLVFHRWTKQHVMAASGLVYGDRGLLDNGVKRGHDREDLTNAIRFVRTAVVNPDSPELAGLQATQVAWLRECNRDLQELARTERLGRTVVISTIPLDPVLQWREQLLSDRDVWASQIANPATIAAFDDLAVRLVDEKAWAEI